jgi:hypothetical protein
VRDICATKGKVSSAFCSFPMVGEQPRHGYDLMKAAEEQLGGSLR